MFTGSLLPPHPHPSAAWRLQRKKHKKREAPPFPETTVHPLILVAFLKNESKAKKKKKKEEDVKRKKTANLENFLEKNYLKLILTSTRPAPFQ